MTQTLRGRILGMTVGTWVGLLAAAPAVAVTAPGGWAEIGWQWRWGSGSIVYDRDLAPIDLQDGGGTFRNSVGPFEIVAWEMLESRTFSGSGGSMTTRNADLANCAPWDQCDMISVVIDLGPLSSGSAAQWQLNLRAPGRLDDRGLPVLGSNWEGGAPQFDGYLSNNLDDKRYFPLDSTFGNWHYAVAAPVPEPESLAMVVIGLAGVGAVARRRRPDSPR